MPDKLLRVCILRSSVWNISCSLQSNDEHFKNYPERDFANDGNPFKAPYKPEHHFLRKHRASLLSHKTHTCDRL